MKVPKSVLLLLVLFPALLQPLSAQNSVTNASRQPLWKIEGKRATVYLLGSIHLLKKENYPLAAPLENAFAKSKVAVFETDLGAADDPETDAKLSSLARLPEGEKLQAQLTPRVYERLSAYLKETGLSPEAVEKLKPGMVALTLVYVEAERLGLDEKLGVDRHYYKRAQKDGKELISLETAEYTMNVVTGLSKQDAEMLLDLTLKEIGTLKNKIGPMVKAWQTGDTKTVAELLDADIKDIPRLYQRFVVERNQRWIRTIEKLIRGDKDAIVIVGAGHLAGKQNLIELLEKKTGLKAAQQ